MLMPYSGCTQAPLLSLALVVLIAGLGGATPKPGAPRTTGTRAKPTAPARPRSTARSHLAEVVGAAADGRGGEMEGVEVAMWREGQAGAPRQCRAGSRRR